MRPLCTIVRWCQLKLQVSICTHSRCSAAGASQGDVAVRSRCPATCAAPAHGESVSSTASRVGSSLTSTWSRCCTCGRTTSERALRSIRDHCLPDSGARRRSGTARRDLNCRKVKVLSGIKCQEVKATLSSDGLLTSAAGPAAEATPAPNANRLSSHRPRLTRRRSASSASAMRCSVQAVGSAEPRSMRPMSA